MSPRQSREGKKRIWRKPVGSRRTLFQTRTHGEIWLSASQAARLVKDHLARPVPCRGGVKLIELGIIRAVYSSKYLYAPHSPELRLYRDDLIKTIGTSRTGKPARAYGRRARDTEAGHVPMPLDGGGDEED